MFVSTNLENDRGVCVPTDWEKYYLALSFAWSLDNKFCTPPDL